MAPLIRLPKLRDQIITVKQIERGETVYVCKVVETGNYYRFNEIQYQLVNLLDGKSTLEEMVEAFNSQNHKIEFDVEFLAEFVESIKDLDIVEHSPEDKRALVREKVRDERRRRAANKNVYGNVLDIKMSAWNPDHYFNTIHPYLRFMYSPAFIIVSFVCILSMLGIWGSEGDRMKAGTLDFFNFANKTGTDVLQFIVILFVISFIHETAHGLTCKHFGGVVPSMGFMIIYFTPCFFVDISDAFLFDRHYKRQWTIFAGGYIELVICSLTTFVWALTSPGTLVNELSYKTLLMTGLLSIIVNYNPLIKLDGYYSLMDYLEISDLWERSFEYTGKWIKKTIFRLPVELDAPPRMERRILLGYSLTSVAYKVLIITVFLVFLKNILFGLFGNGGYLVLGLAIFLAVRHPLFKLGQFLKFAILDKKEVLMTRRSLLYAGSASVFTLGLLTLLPVPIVIRSECIIEPSSTAIVRPAIEGRIEEILVREGQEVKRGDILAVLKNEALLMTLPALEDRLHLCEQEIAEAGHRGARTILAKKLRERELLLEEKRALAEERDALTLRAPLAGLITTPRLHERIGSYLNVGQSFCEIASLEPPLARVPIREYRTDEVAPGQIVHLKFTSYPFTTHRGRVTGLAPAARPDEPAVDTLPQLAADLEPGREFADFEAIVVLEGDPVGLRYGMQGTAKIHVGQATLAGRAGRELQRWFEAHIWW